MIEQVEYEAATTTPDVVATLVANHRQFLSFLEKRVESREVAEDILQEAFIRGLDSSTLREADSATAWFYRVLRNAIVDHYRRRGVESRVLEQVAAESSNEVQPDNELMQAVCSCVTTLLSTLKPEYAQAIRRVELDDVPVTTYAAEEQMTPNAAGVRLFRARQALKKRGSLPTPWRSCGNAASSSDRNHIARTRSGW
ncbi:MAG TPA: sigma-70 family RNA polymerase sigma factor [Thermoanaerobaculia bacterium]|nr:sigma-70 family RNA polymerase sigma factor [Thermoanaerobaculia bacterium]